MDNVSFATALSAHVDDMLKACTRCGKCVDVCPSVRPAGIVDAVTQDLVAGVIDLVRFGHGPEASRTWASSCMLSGACIPACEDGVNPRFLLAMARIAMAKADHALPDRRRRGITAFRDLGRDVSVLSRLQLQDEALRRLGQAGPPATDAARGEPDFVFYTGSMIPRSSKSGGARSAFCNSRVIE